MRVRGEGVKRWLCGLGFMLYACNRAPLVDNADGGHKTGNGAKAGADAGATSAADQQDSGSAGGSASAGLPTVPAFSLPFLFDGGLWPSAFSPPACPLQVGAECDGDEDCAHGHVCCATFDQTRFTYVGIGCQATCSGADAFQLCHDSQSCAPGLVCRRSLVLPYSFLSVCAPPAQVTGTASGRERAGEVECGDSVCEAGRSKCCLTAHFDSSSAYPVAEPPYCAPIGEACMCHHDGNGKSPGGGEDAGP